MFNINDGLLEWNQIFISNNVDFILTEPIYKVLDDNVFIFNNERFIINPKGCKQNMYKFIIDGFIGEYNNDSGFCYFCEFIFLQSTGGKIKSNNEEHHLCDNCMNLWHESINMINKTNNLYIVNDTRTNRITVNVVDNRNFNSITIYYRIIIPLDRFCYKTVSKFVIDDGNCKLCYSNLNYEDEYYFNSKPEKYICNNCLNYSKQIVINDNYYKYLIIINSDTLDDSVSVIMNYFISLLIY